MDPCVIFAFLHIPLEIGVLPAAVMPSGSLFSNRQEHGAEYLRIALRTHAPVSGSLILEVGFGFPDREGDVGLGLLSDLKGLQGSLFGV